MIPQQVDEMLTDDAGRAENADIEPSASRAEATPLLITLLPFP